MQVAERRESPPRAVIAALPLYLASAPPRPSERSHHPSSLSPLALDAPAPQRTPLDSTVHIPRAVESTARLRATLFAAGALAAGAVLAVGVAVGGSTQRATKAEAVLAPPPAKEPLDEGRLAATENAGTEDDGSDAPVTPHNARSDAPLRAPSAARAENPESQTSVLRVPASVSGILVDGTPRRVTGGAIFVTCGRHRIKLPRHPARSVTVPCGRTASL